MGMITFVLPLHAPIHTLRFPLGEQSEVVIFVAAANPPLQELQHIHHG